MNVLWTLCFIFVPILNVRLKSNSKKPVIVGYFQKTESGTLEYNGRLKIMEKDQVSNFFRK